MLYHNKFSFRFILIILLTMISEVFPSETKWIDGFVDNDGIKIHYIEKKVLQPARCSLLFVPGLSMPAWIYEKQLEFFAKNYSVVAMDPRSQGSSSQATEGLYPLGRAQDIKAVVDELELSPVVLIGWSLSVPEIVAYIDHYGSEDIAGIVLIDGLVGLDINSEIFKSSLDWIHHFQIDRQKSSKDFVLGIFKQPQPPEYIEKLTKASLITPTNTFAALWYNTYTTDYRSVLPKIDKPTLVVTSEVSQDLMREMSQSIPNAQFELISNAGHALFVDQPDQFNQLLEKFLKNQIH
jgi:non-heme chloroperoxidase